MEPTPIPEKRAGCRRVTWQAILITLLVMDFAAAGLLFQESHDRTIAVSAFVCGLTIVASGCLPGLGLLAVPLIVVGNRIK
jgi:hypothetical protein